MDYRHWKIECREVKRSNPQRRKIMTDRRLVMDGALLRIEEMAKILCISRSLAYRLVQNGDIPSVRIHTAVRILPADLDRYIQQKRVDKAGLESDSLPFYE